MERSGVIVYFFCIDIIIHFLCQAFLFSCQRTCGQTPMSWPVNKDMLLNQPSLSKFLHFNMTDVIFCGKTVFSVISTDIFVQGTIIIGTRTITWIARPFHLLLNFNILSNIKRHLLTAVSALIKDSANKLLNPLLYFVDFFCLFVSFFILWKERRDVLSLEHYLGNYRCISIIWLILMWNEWVLSLRLLKLT